MSKNVFVFLVILAFASFTAVNAQAVKCVDDTHFEYLGSVFECVQDDPANRTKVCNINYKAGESEICDIVDNICKYDCDDDDETVVKLGPSGYKIKCGDNKICNKDKDSCKEMCTDKCTFYIDFECDGDSKVKIYGLSLPCPEGTVCNKNKRQPCAICHSPSGAKSSVLNWLTVEN